MERGALVSRSIEPTSIIHSIASQCMSSRMEWGKVRMEEKKEGEKEDSDYQIGCHSASLKMKTACRLQNYGASPGMFQTLFVARALKIRHSEPLRMPSL